MPNPLLDDEPDPRVATAAHVLPILLIVPLLALPFRAIGDPVVDRTTWGAFVVGSAALLGTPAVAWSLERARPRVWQLAAVGLLAGLLAMGGAATSGIIGWAARAGGRDLALVLRYGVPVPLAGLMPWSVFRECMMQSAAVGVASALVCWLLCVRPARHRVRGSGRR
jgi:hypothetical protein